MAVIYLKDKPEAESFSYAYVEDADGKLVRVAIDNMKKALGLVEPVDASITLLADNWTLTDDGTYYTQAVTVEGVTEYSRVELQATPNQITSLMNDEIALFIGNESGTITAYCINGTPSMDMTFDIRITEVV